MACSVVLLGTWLILPFNQDTRERTSQGRPRRPRRHTASSPACPACDARVRGLAPAQVDPTNFIVYNVSRQPINVTRPPSVHHRPVGVESPRSRQPRESRHRAAIHYSCAYLQTDRHPTPRQFRSVPCPTRYRILSQRAAVDKAESRSRKRPPILHSNFNNRHQPTNQPCWSTIHPHL